MLIKELQARDQRQKSTLAWAVRIFGIKTACSRRQRTVRFYEEATELFQAVYESERPIGQSFLQRKLYDLHTIAKMLQVIFYVMNRDPGRIGQEVGGTMITLMSLAEVTANSVAAEEILEYDRIHQPETIRKVMSKQKTKVHE